MKRVISNAAIAGLAAGAAMIPAGVLLRRAMGYSLNVYGELVVQALLGRASQPALVLEHFLISWSLAIPVSAMQLRAQRRISLWAGATYGAAIWVVLNSLLLPSMFGRPTPWLLGWPAIWPSLAVHVLYGVVAVAVARRCARGARQANEPLFREHSGTG